MQMLASKRNRIQKNWYSTMGESDSFKEPRSQCVVHSNVDDLKRS